MKTFSSESHRLLCRNISGLLTLALLGLAQPAAAQLLRGGAVDALLAPGSGVTIFTNVVAVWSPYADLGGGPGREGMLPSGTTVAPRFEGAPMVLLLGSSVNRVALGLSTCSCTIETEV